jgi:hypothetical protein
VIDEESPEEDQVPQAIMNKQKALEKADEERLKRQN